MQRSIDFAWANPSTYTSLITSPTRQMASFVPTSVSSSASSSASKSDPSDRPNLNHNPAETILSKLPPLPPDSDEEGHSSQNSFSLPSTKPISPPKGPRPQRIPSLESAEYSRRNRIINDRDEDHEIAIALPFVEPSPSHDETSFPSNGLPFSISKSSIHSPSVTAGQPPSLDPWVQASPDTRVPVLATQKLKISEDTLPSKPTPPADETPMFDLSDVASPFIDYDARPSQPSNPSTPPITDAAIPGLSQIFNRAPGLSSPPLSSPRSPASIPSPISCSPPRVYHRSTPITPSRTPRKTTANSSPKDFPVPSDHDHDQAQSGSLTKAETPKHSTTIPLPKEDTILIGSASILVSDKWDIESASASIVDSGMDEWEKIDCLGASTSPMTSNMKKSMSLGTRERGEDWEHLQRTETEDDWEGASAGTGTSGGQGVEGRDDDDWEEEEDETEFFQPTFLGKGKEDTVRVARGRSTNRDVGAIMSSVSPVINNRTVTSLSPVSPASARAAETRKVIRAEMKELARIGNRGSSAVIDTPNRSNPTVQGLTRGIGAGPTPPRPRVGVLGGILGDW